MKHNNVQNGRQLILLYNDEKLKFVENTSEWETTEWIVDILCITENCEKKNDAVHDSFAFFFEVYEASIIDFFLCPDITNEGLWKYFIFEKECIQKNLMSSSTPIEWRVQLSSRHHWQQQLRMREMMIKEEIT